MKWKGLIALLSIVALLAGFIGVPVARAVTGAIPQGATWLAPVSINISTVGSYIQISFGSSTGSGNGASVVSHVTFSSGVCGSGQMQAMGSPLYPYSGLQNLAVLATAVNRNAPFTITFTGFTYIVPTNGTWSGYTSGTTVFPSQTWTLLNTNNTGGWVAWGTVAMPPLSVSITGSATASIGVNTSFAAVIAGGIAPYSTTWHVDGTGGNEGVILTADNVSPAGLTVKFATISHYIVRATVVDAVGGMASATYDVNLSSAKPVMHGQIIRAEAAESYTFNMYTDGVVLVDGVVAASDCIPSAQYDVTSPTVIMQSEYGYQVWPVSPLPNPLYVYVTYHAPETGFVWSYRFTMDTSILTGAGTWTKSDGTGSDDGATLAPTWVDGLLNRLKIVLIDSSKAAFRWLFVPDAAQMALLMPQGTVQADGTLSKEGNIAASLLEGTTWGAGASEWKLTVHYATFSITLVDIDFTAMRSSAFVRGIRFAIQAVMSMSLVYLVVVLI